MSDRLSAASWGPSLPCLVRPPGATCCPDYPTSIRMAGLQHPVPSPNPGHPHPDHSSAGFLPHLSVKPFLSFPSPQSRLPLLTRRHYLGLTVTSVKWMRLGTLFHTVLQLPQHFRHTAYASQMLHKCLLTGWGHLYKFMRNSATGNPVREVGPEFPSPSHPHGNLNFLNES